MDNHATRYASVGQIALTALVRFLEDSERGLKPVLHRLPPKQISDSLRIAHWMERGGLEGNEFKVFLSDYLSHATRLHHPGFMSHQVSAPNALASVADMLHGAINNPMAVYEMGPANATIELAVLNWMLGHVGWQPMSADKKSSDSGGGVLTHGGSLANLTALLAARAAIAPDSWVEGVPGDLVVLAASASHYSISRSVSILGLGQRAVVALPTDDLGRILPAEVAPVIEGIRASGKRVMALVANACSTGTGLFDDLRAIGEVCRATDIWFHVDAAHGAPALLSSRTSGLLDGVELADSLVWDAHKMMQTAALSTAVLVRSEKHLDRTFQQKASYLIYDKQLTGIDFLHRTVECTKAALGLKAFFAIAQQGSKAMGDFVADQFQTTHQFYDIISARPGFECPYEPESNILCFRYGKDDETQISIREALMAEERFHITSTEISGRRYLRLTVMNMNTNVSTLQGLLTSIERLVNAGL